MIEAFKDPASWAGVPIGEYVVEYASGATETIPVRYGIEVRDPQDGWCVSPIAYGSMAVGPMTCEAEGTHIYTMQWLNPRPEDAIASITMWQLGAPAQVLVAGLEVQ